MRFSTPLVLLGGFAVVVIALPAVSYSIPLEPHRAAGSYGLCRCFGAQRSAKTSLVSQLLQPLDVNTDLPTRSHRSKSS